MPQDLSFKQVLAHHQDEAHLLVPA